MPPLGIPKQDEQVWVEICCQLFCPAVRVLLSGSKRLLRCWPCLDDNECRIEILNNSTRRRCPRFRLSYVGIFVQVSRLYVFYKILLQYLSVRVDTCYWRLISKAPAVVSKTQRLARSFTVSCFASTHASLMSGVINLLKWVLHMRLFKSMISAGAVVGPKGIRIILLRP